MQYRVDAFQFAGQMLGIADIAFDHLQVRVVLGQEFAAVIEDVIDRDTVALIQQLRRQYASAVPGAAGDQNGFKFHETSLEKKRP